MDTVYPSKEEIKFRKKNYGVIKDILKVNIECTICNMDLMNEIISKKMIMIHRSHLFLCCYNCFYKLCEGNEFSCILCHSNKELSNCGKCNHNACNRCIENHKLDQESHGVLNKCFACTPQILWKQRAQSANVLKVFSSQLDMPNGLLVNEIEREQNVRKYLIKEANNDYNPIIDKIKNQICIDFMFNSFKKNIIEKLTDYSPEINDGIPNNEHLKQFIHIGEYILKKTCSTLTDLKRIFNLNSNLNPSVYAIMKSLLKPVDEDENELNTSKLTENTKINLQNNKSNQSLKICKTRCSRSSSEKDADDNLKITTPSSENINMDPINKNIIKEVAVIVERLDDSVLSKIIEKKLSKNIITDYKTDKIVHPLDLFNDNSSSDDNECTRKLRSHKRIKMDKKEDNIPTEKLPKHKKLDTKSDDEKEIDRLINMNNIGKYKGKKVLPVENGNDVNEQTDNNQTFESNKNTNSLMVSKNDEIDKMKLMKQTIQNIDEIDSDTNDNSQNNETTVDFCDVISEVEYTTDIPLIVVSESNGDESEDSSLNEVINMCLTTLNQPAIDNCDSKAKKDKINYNDVFTASETEDELENEENAEMVKSSNNNNNMPTCSFQSLCKISSSSGSDSKKKIKQSGRKRKVYLQTDSDSSSKYFKKTLKKPKRNDGLRPISSSSRSSNNSSSSDEYQAKPVRIQKRKKKINNVLSNSDEVSDASNGVNRSSKKGRKNIRKLKTEEELSELTQNALKEEEDRKKRIESRQKLYNKMYEIPIPCIESVSKLVLDFEPETKKELVTVHPNLVKFLKPHQVEGIQFLWNSVFESLKQIKVSKGNGSILAHCMGLGKTLQVVTLVHTLFRHPETGIKTVLVVTPHATIENWCNEFHKWLKDIPEEQKCSVFNLTETKTYESRKYLIQEWREHQGVLITSYHMYRMLLNYQQIKKFPAILEGLVDPGPDLIICDEGHILKTQTTAISKALNKIKTLRRIVLTGTPLQNNLKEYHCMVDFIRPNLLGSIKDFTNRFINPITNGQYSDSTPQDVRLMKRRSHVLHRMLEGFIQRFDYSVLTPYLPPKHEYVIYLKMSDIQIELYRNYLDNHRQPELFTNYNILQMIWTHPKLLSYYAKRAEDKKEKEILKDFVNDGSDSTSVSNSNSIEEHNEILDVPNAKIPEMDLNWWKPLLAKKNLDTVYPYSKFIMMFSILNECEKIGDKVILFSQSLYTLNLIQDFLENAEDLTNDFGGPYGNSWIQGKDFFRIDGSVSLKNREDCCTKFNDVTNTKLRLLLLSTKAFNLGINLVGANRVIIFDVTWNPSLNVQSIFRIFRFGQTKPCYIYRFVSEGTMEQKIYERQISKLSMAFRVVDEHQIDRHFNAKDQEVLYEFEPTFEPQTTLNLPKDRLMAELILKHKDLVINILEHDSLLQNNEAEELNESDRNAAWEDYQKEKDGALNQPHQNIQLQMNDQFYLFNLDMQQDPLLRTEPEDISLFNMLRSYFPQATMLQLNDMLNQVKRAQGVEQ